VADPRTVQIGIRQFRAEVTAIRPLPSLASALHRPPAEVRMVFAVEVRGRHKGRLWTGPEEQLAGMKVIACPELLAFCLMSTHFHLVLEVEDEAHVGRVVRRICNALDRTADERHVARTDEPHFQILGDDYAVLRYVAYAHRNPVTAQMVVDPLSWFFSSHRDLYGLRTTAWFSPERLHSRITGELDGRWLHQQAGGGLPVPVLVAPVERAAPQEPLDMIARTVASVYGSRAVHASRRTRRCFASAARFDGWDTASIAAHLNRSDRQVRRLRAEDTPTVRAVLASLRDVRLRPTGSQWWQVPAEARGPSLWDAWRESRG
jgi:hypothetical protein